MFASWCNLLETLFRASCKSNLRQVEIVSNSHLLLWFESRVGFRECSHNGTRPVCNQAAWKQASEWLAQMKRWHERSEQRANIASWWWSLRRNMKVLSWESANLHKRTRILQVLSLWFDSTQQLIKCSASWVQSNRLVGASRKSGPSLLIHTCCCLCSSAINCIRGFWIACG